MALTIPTDEKTGDVEMESTTHEAKSVPSFQPFTTADRIKQLNDIDKSIAKLLQSAGLAIKTLTVCQTDTTHQNPSTEDRPQTFTDATNTYLKGLHSVDVRLKRQIYGLNEAGIIAMAKELPSRADGLNPESSRVARDNVMLDVGWLNSRSSEVGRGMEAELWAKARTFLEALEAKKNDNQEIEGGVENRDMADWEEAH